MQVVGRVELLRQPAEGDEPGGWLAKIGDLVVPIAGYQIGDDEDGTVLVSLAVPAASVRIEANTAAADRVGGKPVQLAERGPARPWGAPGPDPRADIPGWQPSMPLGAQVAAQARRQAAAAQRVSPPVEEVRA